ncbi:hypothetical protein [Rhodococcus sp. IEGM 1330]|uniref:hypothetical protein n=1 Tax=Rhodococcus sp. IEGM 1330 TaxID=3082225 RepID=UPI00295546DE|nr:hypothetical protein [Rhodococcus sp. IEGM 1330]MDV8022268.1 hypothetical protein [Rhodococcus sp. IEGM 1330]
MTSITFPTKAGADGAYASKSVKVRELASRMNRPGRSLYSGVTYLANSTEPTGMTEVAYGGNQARFRVGSALTDLGGLWAPLINGSTASPGTSPSGFTAEVIHAATRFVWRLGYGSSHHVYVDDQPVTASPQPNNSAGYTYVSLTFPDATPRRIRIECVTGTLLAGAYTTAANTFHAPPPRAFQAALIGDSWAQQGIAEHLSMVCGWNVQNLGQAGTGYLADGGGAGGSLGHTAFGSTQRRAALAALGPLNLIMDLGSTNDTPFTPANIVTAATAHWAAVATDRPGVPLVVIGPEPARGGAEATAINTALKAAAVAHPAVAAYIDWRTLSTLTGTGKTTAKTGDGLCDFYMGADDLHPIPDGYLYLARELSGLIGPVLVEA